MATTPQRTTAPGHHPAPHRSTHGLPAPERSADGSAAVQWSLWSTQARLVVTDPATLQAAHDLVTTELAAIELACSRFRPDSEILAVQGAGGVPVTVSALLAELVAAALRVARVTDGDVDPTVGAAMRAAGYDRDIELLRAGGGAPVPVRVFTAHRAPGWTNVRLDGRTLTVPAGVELDLGASAKALAADRCSALVHDRLGVGVLVSLGGDIATAGPARAGGWQVLVQDRPGDPACRVTLAAGSALATSSTTNRTWAVGDRVMHHVLDPRTCLPAQTVWRTATVCATRCVDANALSTAALIRGAAAPAWLAGLGVASRLVAEDSSVRTLAGWPAASRELPEAPSGPATAASTPASNAREGRPS